MAQYVRFFENIENVKMNAQNWEQYSEVRTASESPGENWYLIQKNQKPTLNPGQMLGWTYTIDNGVAIKNYFAWEQPRDISKRKLMNGLKEANLWTIVKGFMEQNDIWDDFAMATTLDSNDPLIENAITQLVAAGLTTRETLEGIINASVAD